MRDGVPPWAASPPLLVGMGHANGARPGGDDLHHHGCDSKITPTPGGSRVTYTLTQAQIANPVLRLRLPVVRSMAWRVMIPMFAGRGFRNLLADAEAEPNTQAHLEPPAPMSGATAEVS
jgi:hypothetical protein